jgi:ABC-type Fe3+/spermidine/putrescine transport system ATPase subunit
MNQEVPQMSIENIVRLNRWVVILGGPGSAKTTPLRWITRIFAEMAHKDHEEVVLNEDNCVPVRIPILIRIGEFASWLDQHQTKTLMDYIGDHTWFSERYCHDDDDKSVLKVLFVNLSMKMCVRPILSQHLTIQALTKQCFLIIRMSLKHSHQTYLVATR